jgi:tRNA pseudouridine13 synthase
VSIGEAQAHSAKLRRGHAAGNTFSITVRDPDPDWSSLLEAKLERLGGKFANFYGAQRFGHEGKNLDHGLRRLGNPRRARDSDFFVNAAQSALFNLYVLARRDAGFLESALAGDLLMDASGRLLACEDAATGLALQAAGWQITGPMVGGKIDRPEPDSAAGQLEADILSRLGVGDELLAAWGSRVRGARRRTLADFEFIGVTESPATEVLPAGYRVEFALPSGAYATVLLREFMSPPG